MKENGIEVAGSNFWGNKKYIIYLRPKASRRKILETMEYIEEQYKNKTERNMVWMWGRLQLLSYSQNMGVWEGDVESDCHINRTLRHSFNVLNVGGNQSNISEVQLIVLRKYKIPNLKLIP
jgi:hypothetical protein